MEHAAEQPLVNQLFLAGPKDLGLDGLQLEPHLVGHLAAAFHAAGPLALEPVGQEQALLGQGMMGRGGRFRKRQARVAPGDDVPRAGDVDLGLVVPAPERVRLADLEQLRMQRPAVELGIPTPQLSVGR